MNDTAMTLTVQAESMGVCRMSPTAPVPEWGCQGSFFSLTRTMEELSIVCAEEYIPEPVLSERGWRMLKIEGVLDFGLVGVVAGVSAVLADARLGIFVMSTYNTDYILVKQSGLTAAIEALRSAGYEVVDRPSSGD